MTVNRKRNSVLSIRISDDIRQYLETECKKTGRNLTKQVEHCILHSMLPAKDFERLVEIEVERRSIMGLPPMSPVPVEQPKWLDKAVDHEAKIMALYRK